MVYANILVNFQGLQFFTKDQISSQTTSASTIGNFGAGLDHVTGADLKTSLAVHHDEINHQ